MQYLTPIIKHLTAFTLLISVSLTTHAQSKSPTQSLLELQHKELTTAITNLRFQLADMQLKIKQTLREAQAFRQFLKQNNPSEDIAKWQAELETLNNQYAELAEVRRHKLAKQKAADQARRVAIAKNTARTKDQKNKKPPVDLSHPRWNVNYKVSLIYTGENDTIIHRTFDPLYPERIHTFIEKVPTVDRQNIHLEGTFQNTSTKPWRYTFEARLATRRSQIISSEHYQTPMLQPNDLHKFKIKMTVEDISKIKIYQIGNISADGPKKQVAKPQPQKQ